MLDWLDGWEKETGRFGRAYALLQALRCAAVAIAVAIHEVPTTYRLWRAPRDPVAYARAAAQLEREDKA